MANAASGLTLAININNNLNNMKANVMAYGNIENMANVYQYQY